MIHNWQCKRCTHEWQTSCFGEFMQKPEDRERNHRQLWSHLCWDCFEQLEAGEIAGLELFDLFIHLRKRVRSMYEEGRVLRTYQKDGLWHEVRYSGMCHEYRSTVYGPDGNTAIDEGNFEAGFTAEQEEMHKIEYEVQDAYEGAILSQRTAKRIELDEFQKTSGFVFFGSQPRPEGFVGDPPGKQRFEVLCGIDFASGKFVPPTIQLSKSGLSDIGEKQ
jgi:hypothetical protein